MTSTRVDADLFTSSALPLAEPDPAILAGCREPDRFALKTIGDGVVVGRYVGEPTARNSEVDALVDLVIAAEGAGYHAVITVDAAGRMVRITEARPHRWGVEDEPGDDGDEDAAASTPTAKRDRRAA